MGINRGGSRVAEILLVSNAGEQLTAEPLIKFSTNSSVYDITATHCALWCIDTVHREDIQGADLVNGALGWGGGEGGEGWKGNGWCLGTTSAAKARRMIRVGRHPFVCRASSTSEHCRSSMCTWQHSSDTVTHTEHDSNKHRTRHRDTVLCNTYNQNTCH